VGLFVLMIISIIFSFGLGKYPIEPNQVVGIIFSKVSNIEPFWTEKMETIFFNVRLPRIILACLVGCCLSAAGAAYQSIFLNPMAAPDILGASNGAAFGAAIAILFYRSGREITISAFIFSLITVGLVYFISKRAKGNKVLGLILAGIMVSSLFSAATSFIKLVADPNEQLPAITYWLMGSLSGTKIDDVKFVILPMIIGILPLILLSWQINMLTIGEDEAKTMGVNTKLIRLISIIAATLITASSVSVSGMIGWVGLVIPHLSRKLVGNNFVYLLPTSMLFGATFLLLVDNISRNLWTSEVPIGILTAFVGAPFFIYLITRKEQ
ncbi:MAG: FecCD family ABC transporter permease, partial [Intestinibacter sp.]